MSDLRELIVIGAGPAGAAAAQAARQAGVGDVLVLEKSSWPRRKACGGVISAQALAWVEERFGPTPALAFGSPSRLVSLRLRLGAEESYRLKPCWPALQLERKHFDAHLLQASQAEWRCGRGVEALKQGPASVTLTLEGGARLEARYVVLAGGAECGLGPARQSGRFMAFAGRVCFEAVPFPPERTLLLPSDPAQGLITIDPVGKRRLALTTTVKDPRRWKEAHYLAINQAQEFGLGLHVEREAEFGWVARGGPWFGEGRVLLAGDAAGMSFALGFGLEGALRSGFAAGRAVAQALIAGQDLHKAQHRELAAYLKRRKVERRVDRLLRGRCEGFGSTRDLGHALRQAPLRRRPVVGLRLRQLVLALDEGAFPPRGFPV